MSGQAKITLRPPAHRDFLSSHPGIPESAGPSPSFQPPVDPLISLPVITRAAAHLSGTVEVRPGNKAGGTRAKWLRVELEKIETIPAQQPAGGAGGKVKEVKTQARFVELIGNGPGTLWTAAAAGSGAASVMESQSRKGKKGKDDEDDGWAPIPEGNYPFQIALPEGLPPTTEVDSKGSGVAYQLVATLCSKGKKTLLKSNPKPIMLTSQAGVILLKADILPTWPIYSPILPTPIPPLLEWANPNSTGPTIGETRESKLAVRREGGGGEVWMKCTRETTAFGPGDAVRVRVQVGYGGSEPIKLTRLDFVLRETITFRYPAAANTIVKAQPKVNSIFTANASVSADPNNPAAFAVLYANEPVAFNLTGIIPSGHSRVTVRTAKYCDVTYALKVRAMIEGGEEVSVDGWPVVIGGVGSRESAGIMQEIGWVSGLCDRPGLLQDASHAAPVKPAFVSTPASTPAPVSLPPAQTQPASANNSPPPRSPFFQPVVLAPQAQARPVNAASYDVISESERRPHNSPPPPPASAQPSYITADEEKQRLFNSARNTATQQQQFRIHNADVLTASYVAPITAEEEKLRLHRAAEMQRDRLQTSLGSSGGARTSPPIDVDAKASLHQAAVLQREHLQGQLVAPAVQTQPSEDRKTALFHTAVETRDTLQGSINGGGSGPARSATTHVFPSSPPVSLSPPLSLGRATTLSLGGESEKKRLFESAKALARQRQMEARMEFERQNALLEEMEREESNMTRLEMEAEQARREEEERLAQEHERMRIEEERRVQEEFAREQAERARAAEAKWQREEQARQEAAKALYEEHGRQQALQRQADQRRQEAEQRRQLEQQRQAEAQRQSELLKARMGGPPAGHQIYDNPPPGNEGSEIISPTPMASNHRRINSRGSFSSSRDTSSPSLSYQNASLGNALERSGSTASFAPTTPMTEANSAFYLNSIAIASSLSRNPTASLAEKNEYLRRLREGSAATSTQRGFPEAPRRQHPLYDNVQAAPSYGDPAPGGYASPPQGQQYQQPRYDPGPPQDYGQASQHYNATPQPSRIDTTAERRASLDQYTPSPASGGSYIRPPQSPPTSAPRDNGKGPARSETPQEGTSGVAVANENGHAPEPHLFKSALQEKEEEKARRLEEATRLEEAARAEVRGGKQAVRVEDDSLPSYDRGATVAPLKTAAQEKADLRGHYDRAKAAVDAYQSRGPPPPPPPARQRTADQLHSPIAVRSNGFPSQPLQSTTLQSINQGPPSLYGQHQTTNGSAPPPPPAPPSQYAQHAQPPPLSPPSQCNSLPLQSPHFPQPQQSLSPITESGPTSHTAGDDAYGASAPPPSAGRHDLEGSDVGSVGSSSEVHRDPQVSAGKKRSMTMDLEATAPSAPSPDGGQYEWGTAPPQSAEGAAPWMLSSPDFGSFNLADGLGFDAAKAYAEVNGSAPPA